MLLPWLHALQTEPDRTLQLRPLQALAQKLRAEGQAYKPQKHKRKVRLCCFAHEPQQARAFGLTACWDWEERQQEELSQQRWCQQQQQKLRVRWDTERF